MKAVSTGDEVKENVYAARKSMLADFMEYVRGASDEERDRASSMLETIDDLSPDSQSPTFDDSEHEMDVAPCLHCKVSCQCSSMDAQTKMWKMIHGSKQHA